MRELYTLKRTGYSLESIDFAVDPDDGSCSICYTDGLILHIRDLRQYPKLNFDICEHCLTQMLNVMKDSFL